MATVDGTTQLVTITVSGTNDAAVISGTTTGSVIEAGGTTPGTPVATGTLTDIDVDNEDNSFLAVTSPTVSNKGYGSFMITAAGAWTYMLDNSNGAVQALDPGRDADRHVHNQYDRRHHQNGVDRHPRQQRCRS